MLKNLMGQNIKYLKKYNLIIYNKNEHETRFSRI